MLNMNNRIRYSHHAKLCFELMKPKNTFKNETKKKYTCLQTYKQFSKLWSVLIPTIKPPQSKNL